MFSKFLQGSMFSIFFTGGGVGKGWGVSDQSWTMLSVLSFWDEACDDPLWISINGHLLSHIGQVCTGSFVYLLPNVQYCGEEATGAQSKLNNASFPFLSQLPLRISFWNYQNYLSRPQRNHPYQFANQRVSERCFLFFAQTKLSHLIAFWLFWCQCSLTIWESSEVDQLEGGGEERLVLTHFGMETNGLFQGNMKIYRADHLWGKFQISLFGPPHSIALASIAHKSPFLILPNLQKLRNLNEGFPFAMNSYIGAVWKLDNLK